MAEHEVDEPFNLQAALNKLSESELDGLLAEAEKWLAQDDKPASQAKPPVPDKNPEDEILKRIEANAQSENFDPKAFLKESRLLYQTGELEITYLGKDETNFSDPLRKLREIYQHHNKAIDNADKARREDQILGRVLVTPEEKKEEDEVYNLLSQSEFGLMYAAKDKDLQHRLIAGEPVTIIEIKRRKARSLEATAETITPRKFNGKGERTVIADRLIATHGVYGKVYAGRYEDENTYSVAIKEGHYDKLSGSSAEKDIEESFKHEAEVLIRLEDAGSKHTPKLHYLKLGGSRDEPPYIVMDLAKGDKGYSDDRIFKLGEETVGEGLEEKLALEVTRQLVEVIEVARQAGYHNKEIPKETIWDPDTNNLTVIDWNVTEKPTPENLQSSIVRVAYFLNNLLISRTVDRNYFPLEDHHYWGLIKQVVNPQTQEILRKLFNPNESERYTNLATLRKDLEDQIARLSEKSPTPDIGSLHHPKSSEQTRPEVTKPTAKPANEEKVQQNITLFGLARLLDIADTNNITPEIERMISEEKSLNEMKTVIMGKYRELLPKSLGYSGITDMVGAVRARMGKRERNQPQ